MTALPAELELGGRASWWHLPDAPPAALPAGVSIDHGDHQLLVPWIPAVDGSPVAPFTLDSLQPLTVSEMIRCRSCGVQGWIQAGEWLPNTHEGSRPW